MRRTVIIVEHPDPKFCDELWITPSGLLTKELEKLVWMLKTGRAGHGARERYVADSGVLITLSTDTYAIFSETDKYDSLDPIPYTDEMLKNSGFGLDVQRQIEKGLTPQEVADLFQVSIDAVLVRMKKEPT